MLDMVSYVIVNLSVEFDVNSYFEHHVSVFAGSVRKYYKYAIWDIHQLQLTDYLSLDNISGVA